MALWAPPALRRRPSRTPGQIAAFAHWWRADSVTHAGGIVSAWHDRIGTVDLVGAGLDGGPVFEASHWGFNGQPVIYFRAGQNDLLYKSPFVMPQPVHIFMVLYAFSHASGNILFDLRQEGHGYNLGIYQNTFPDIVQSGTNTGNIVYHPGIWSVLYDGLWRGADSFQRIDHGAKATGIDMGGFGAENLYVGRSAVNFSGPNLRIAELAIAGAEVVGSDLAAVAAYFKDRYGIP